MTLAKDRRDAERFLLRVPHHVDCFQLLGMDLAANPTLAARDRFAHRPFVVRYGYLVRMGVLSMHRLALAGPGAAGPPGPAVLYSAAPSGIDWTRSRSCTRRYTGRCDARRCLAPQRRAVRQGPARIERDAAILSAYDRNDGVGSRNGEQERSQQHGRDESARLKPLSFLASPWTRRSQNRPEQED